MKRIASRRAAVAATCAMAVLGAMSLAPGAMAKQPGGGGTGTTGGTNATAYSGEAQVVRADVSALGALIEAHVGLSHAGPLPSTGGFDHASLLSLGVSGPPLFLAANVASAHTAGAGDRSNSTASVADVHLGLGAFSPSLLRLDAGLLRSYTLAKCGANGAEVGGGSNIANLKLAVGGGLFVAINVTGAPNQVIEIPGVARITINEQIVAPGSITVNALHVQLTPPDNVVGTILNPILTGDVVISSAHSDISCQGGPTPPPPPPCQVKDWVTGGGQIGDEQTSFGMVGGQKPNGLTGHFNLVDRSGAERHIQGTDVTGYTVVNPTTRTLTYSGTVDGAPATITVTVVDNGEPGTKDTISVSTNTGYAKSGLVQGNIQIHKPNGCDTQTSGGGGKPPRK